ncbi:MAG: hypothetical protein HRT45_15785 [Bdellovibrionales bacterium]|nr:hypothetical protein [Bdellovibrionales bacterium]
MTGTTNSVTSSKTLRSQSHDHLRENLNRNYYNYSGKPKRVVRVVERFTKLSRAIKKQASKAKMIGFVSIAISIGLVVAGIFLDGGSDRIFLSLIFPAITLALFLILTRTVIQIGIFGISHEPYNKVKGIMAGIFGSMFIFMFVIPIALDASSNWVTYQPMNLATLLFSLVPAIGVVFGLNQLFFSWSLKRNGPQPAELFFISQILSPLLKELAPNSKFRITFNPFGTQASRTDLMKKFGKQRFVDHVLMAVIPIGDDGVIKIQASDFCQSKGQRKHKGWKHKFKMKISYRFPEPLDDKKVGIAWQNMQTLTDAYLKAVPPNPPYRFRVAAVGSFPAEFEVNSTGIRTVFTSPPQVTASKEIPETVIYHPRFVLRAIKAMTESYVYTMNDHQAKANLLPAQTSKK